MTIDSKINTLIAYVLAEDPERKENLRSALKAIDRATPGETSKDPDFVVHELLAEIGVPPGLVGYRYLHGAIVHVYRNPGEIDHITFGLYPQLAMQFDTTSSRVERGIRSAINSTFEHGDTTFLERNFRSQINPKTGAIPNGHFIARCAILVKQRMRKV